MKFAEKRTWSPASVRMTCINNEWYGCGDNEDYSRMLKLVGRLEPTTDNIARIAMDILDHSGDVLDPRECGETEEELLASVMFALNRGACITHFIPEN